MQTGEQRAVKALYHLSKTFSTESTEDQSCIEKKEWKNRLLCKYTVTGSKDIV